jgi:hypothetical protein
MQMNCNEADAIRSRSRQLRFQSQSKSDVLRKQIRPNDIAIESFFSLTHACRCPQKWLGRVRYEEKPRAVSTMKSRPRRLKAEDDQHAMR